MGKLDLFLDNESLNSIEDQFDLILKDNRTVLEDMEMVMYGLKEWGLSDTFKEKYEKYTSQICQIYNLTFNEAVLFTLFIEESNQGKIDFYDFKQICKCSKLKFLNYLDEIESLVKKKLIKRVSSNRENKIFRVLDEVVESVRRGSSYQVKKHEKMTKDIFYLELAAILENGKNYDIHPDDIQSEIMDLVENNKDLTIVQNLDKLKLDPLSLIVLLVASNIYINEELEYFEAIDLDDYFDVFDFSAIKQKLKNGSHILFSKELIEYQDTERVTNPNIYKISNKTKQLLEIDQIIKIQKGNTSNLIDHKSIKERTLFYNPQELTQVQKLHHLMEEKQFQMIQEKLNTQNFRIRFNCYFMDYREQGKPKRCIS